MPATAESARQARLWFRNCLQHWQHAGPGGTGAAADAESVFGELAANAIRHSRRWWRATVTVSPDAVRCDVRDGSWRVPRDGWLWLPGRESGRGLAIVKDLASTWGYRRHLWGKTVWFELRPAQPGLA
jgi:hypothetical protein